MTDTTYRSGDFSSLFSTPEVAAQMGAALPGCHRAAAEFWRVPLEAPHLTGRMKELILFAMHASAASLNETSIRRQIDRARAAGASEADLIDVLISIVGLANHALYSSVPVLQEELRAAGIAPQEVSADISAFAAAKERFISIRKFWNPDRDPLAERMPDYFGALTDLSVAAWDEGSLE